MDSILETLDERTKSSFMTPSLENVYDYEKAAARIMEPAYFTFYAGGAADNLTRDDNRAAFDRIRLLPRMLRDLTGLDTSTHIGGQRLAAPMMTAPTSMNRLAHPDGELGIGRAAKTLGIVQILSTMSTCAVEEVTALGHDVWFQLYMFRDREASKTIIQRAEAAGCKALVLTVDVPMIGLRKTLARGHFERAAEFPLPNLMKPGSDGEKLVANLSDQFDPSLTWEGIDWLRSVSSLPVWVKGILRADDAKLAVEAGVNGIIVSNHGGRQLDTAVAAIDALPAIADAVGGETPVIVDGGIRRGSDILKAIALGAGAVLVGRPPLWGLAVDGGYGALQVLEILVKELENVMAQCGCASIADISEDLVLKRGERREE